MVDKEKTLSQIREGVCGLGEIKLAYVFGSFLQGERFNDIDVAIVTGPHDPHDERAAVRIARELERKMEPRMELDVRILNSAPVTFQYEVIKNGSLVFSRDEEIRIEYESGVISEYLDYRESEDFLTEGLLEG